MAVSLKDVLINLTMFQGVIPGIEVKLVDGSYWSLAVEIQFYILCSILLFIGLIKKPSIVTFIAMFIIGIIKLLYLALIYEVVTQGMFQGVVILIFVSLFYLLINNKLRFLDNKFLNFLGVISYSLYLVHQNIGYIVINFIENIGFKHETFIIVPIFISITIATVLTYFVEKPIIKAFKNRNPLVKNRKDGKYGNFPFTSLNKFYRG